RAVRRRVELLAGPPLGPEPARALAVPPLSAIHRPRRTAVPPPWAEGHRHRALRRRGAAVRAGGGRHARHAAAPLPAGKHVRGGDLGGRVPGAGLGVRRVLRRGGRGGGPAGAGPARPAGGGRRRLGGGAVWLALVRRPRRRPARAGPAL